MDPVSMTFLGLLGVVVAGAWVSFGGRSQPTSPRHRAVPAPPPRVRRRGFGTQLASTPVRRRTWSPFVYVGMWSELHR